MILGTVRVFALARKLDLQSQALLQALEHMGVSGATPASAIDEATAQAVVELLAEQATRAREEAEKVAAQAGGPLVAAPSAPAGEVTAPTEAVE